MKKIFPITQKDQSGFTIVELLITLFVAAAFLTSGYQLFNLVIKDSGQARADSRASSVAYDYMRRYSTSVVSPCVASTPLSNVSTGVAGLSNVTVTVSITCPYSATTSLSKIDVTVLYNSPQQTMEYSTYVAL
jgi:prepilin-type N-terminal cleavage/methylation domain-containing protein